MTSIEESTIKVSCEPKLDISEIFLKKLGSDTPFFRK
jgi:hypothetical protein